MSRLDGKAIIVTGGTQGIGEAVALHAAKCGAEGVVICGRQEDKGRGVAARIEDLGCAVEYVPADLVRWSRFFGRVKKRPISRTMYGSTDRELATPRRVRTDPRLSSE